MTRFQFPVKVHWNNCGTQPAFYPEGIDSSSGVKSERKRKYHKTNLLPSSTKVISISPTHFNNQVLYLYLYANILVENTNYSITALP